RSPEAHSVFGTGALLLCQPSEMVRVAGVAPCGPCASTILVPNCWARANARPLLTLHPEKNGTRGRSLTFIPGVRSAVLCGLSYASVNGRNGRDCTFGLLHVGQALFA